MSYKKSSTMVQLNKEKWTRNLVQFQSTSHRANVPLEESSLSSRSVMPLKMNIVGRSLFLMRSIKGRKDRVVEIAKEVSLLWVDKLNSPIISEQAIRAKIEKVMLLYSTCAKKGNFEPLQELFDITKNMIPKRNIAEKEMYSIQSKSNANVGFSTSQPFEKKSLHPPKRMMPYSDEASHSSFNPTPKKNKRCSNEDIVTNGDDEEAALDDSDWAYTLTRNHNKSEVSLKLVPGAKISPSKAEKICKQLMEEGIVIDIPNS